MSEDDYYTHVPLNVIGSLKAVTPERLAQLLKAESDLAAARALLREAQTWTNALNETISDELLLRIGAALAGGKK